MIVATIAIIEFLSTTKKPSTKTMRGADWAAWFPGNCQVGRLVCRPSGPPRQMSKYMEVRRFTAFTGEGQEQRREKVAIKSNKVQEMEGKSRMGEQPRRALL